MSYQKVYVVFVTLKYEAFMGITNGNAESVFAYTILPIGSNFLYFSNEKDCFSIFQPWV